MSSQFCKTTPCNNCPYRTDAPLQHWSIDEFKDLLAKESDFMGSVYGCHKNDGKVCTGWLIKQDENRIPSISLRLELIKNKVEPAFLDSLYSPAPLYKSVLEMCIANYPEHFLNHSTQ